MNFLNNLNNLNFGFILKLIFLFILIMISLYLLYLENKISLKTNNQSRNLLLSNHITPQEKLAEIEALKIKQCNSNSPLTSSEQQLLNSDNHYRKALSNCQMEIDKCHNDAHEFFVKRAAKSSILDIDLHSYLKSFSSEELLAFSGLLLNSLILSHTLSIIITLYGDYLISRFDLVNRYPRLAKIIKLRKTLQAYYLKISFTWIILAVIPQMVVYIVILEPRLLELFNVFV